MVFSREKLHVYFLVFVGLCSRQWAFLSATCQSKEENTMVFGDSENCYHLPHWSNLKNFSAAVAECQKRNLTLAKISIVPEDLSKQFWEAAASLYCSCFWIGVSDLDKEGEWKWSDGTAADSLDWTFDFLDPPITSLKDDRLKAWNCGRLCFSRMNESMVWMQGSCAEPRCYLCQYPKKVKKEVTSTIDPPSQPTSQTTSQTTTARHRRESPQVMYSVVSKISEDKYIQGDSLFKTKVPLITMCSRWCSKAAGCDIINFNPSTGECRGFRKQLTFAEKTISGWQTWRTKTVYDLR